MSIKIGVGGVPKNVSNMWVGVDGVPKKVKKAWIGVGGVPKLFYSSLGTPVVTKVTSDGVLTWTAAENATKYIAQKYDSVNEVWYSGSSTTSTSYTYSTFNTTNTKVRVIAKDDSGASSTSADYDVNWIKLTFNANGGSCDVSYYDRIAGEEVGSLPTATRSGYTFDYWTAGSTSGSRVYPTSAYSTNMTFYAHWTQNTVYYTITFNGNGGTPSQSSVNVASGTTLSLSSYTATKSNATSANVAIYGYTFKGWYTSSSGGSKVTSVTVTGNKTYYAQYTQYVVLGAPKNVKGVKSTKKVTWTAATNATKYKVFKSTNPSTSTIYNSGFVTGTSHTFSSSANMNYVWVVAYDDSGNEISSAVVQST